MALHSALFSHKYWHLWSSTQVRNKNRNSSPALVLQIELSAILIQGPVDGVTNTAVVIVVFAGSLVSVVMVMVDFGIVVVVSELSNLYDVAPAANTVDSHAVA